MIAMVRFKKWAHLHFLRLLGPTDIYTLTRRRHRSLRGSLRLQPREEQRSFARNTTQWEVECPTHDREGEVGLNA